MEKKIYLVTGATGFVGSHMVRLLVNKGVQVRVFVRDKAKAVRVLGEMANKVEIYEGTLEDKAAVIKALQGIYGVYHIGAAYREAKHPEEYFFKVNFEGTKTIFEEGIKSGVQRIIYCSTTGVLGDVKNPPADHTTPYAPLDMYQRSKCEAEKLVLDYYKQGRMSGVVIRPAMIYGPEDTRFLKMFKMIARGTFFYVGTGQQLVHYINVEDLVRAFLLAMDNQELNGEIYTIAGEKIVSLKVMVDLIAENLGVRKPWIYLPIVPMQLVGVLCETLCKPFGIEPPLYKRRVDFFTKNRSFDTTKASKELGYYPERNFQDEVKYVTNWYKNSGWL